MKIWNRLFYDIRSESPFELVNNNDKYEGYVTYYGIPCLLVDNQLKALTWHSQLMVWFVWLVARFWMQKNYYSCAVVYMPKQNKDEQGKSLLTELVNHRIKPLRSLFFQNKWLPLLPIFDRKVESFDTEIWHFRWLVLNVKKYTYFSFEVSSKLWFGELLGEIKLLYYEFGIQLDLTFTNNDNYWANWWNRLTTLKNKKETIEVGQYKGYSEYGKVYGIKCWANRTKKNTVEHPEGTTWWRNWLINLLWLWDCTLLNEYFWKKTYRKIEDIEITNKKNN